MGILCLWLAAFASYQMPASNSEPKPRTLTLAASMPGDIALAELVLAEMKRRQLFGTAWSTKGIAILEEKKESWQQWLSQEQADVALVLGSTGLRAAKDPGFELPLPVIAGFYHDPSLFGLGYDEWGRSGKDRLSFVVPGPRLHRDLRQFSELVGGTSMAVVMAAPFTEHFPEFEKHLQSIGEDLELEVVFISAGSSPQLVLNPLNQQSVDGVLLGPLPHLTLEQRTELYRELTARGQPTYAMNGLSDVQRGAFAGAVNQPQYQLARRLVDQLEAFDRGEPLATLPAYLPLRESMSINGETAKAIGFPVDLDVRLKADILFASALKADSALDFFATIEKGLDNNPDLEARKQAAKAARFQKKAVQSAWLPQLGAVSQKTRNNRDNPLIAAGLSPETQTSLVISGSQVLFDEATLAQSRVAKWEWQQQVAMLDQQTQETIRQVGLAFVNVGIEQSLLQVAIKNLKLTRSNLQVAKTRVSLGAAGLEEQLRWESLEAQQRSQVYGNQARWQSAHAQLERLLGTSLEKSWQQEPLVLTQEASLFFSQSWLELMEMGGDKLETILADMALARSPPVLTSVLQTKVTQRLYTQTKRSFFLPKISLNASLTDVLDQEFQARTGTGPSFSLEQDGQNWNVTLEASIPIFNGGRRVHQMGAARANHRQAQATLKATKLTTRANVSKALAAFSGSQPQISLSELAADRAQQSLEIILAKYEQGSADVLDIERAQEQAIAQKREAAIARYNHIANLMELQTTLSFFDWQWSGEKRQRWLEALRAELKGPASAGPREEKGMNP